MSELVGLISRVEAATGPDRELDADIALALFHPNYHFPDPVLNRRPSGRSEAYERLNLVGSGDHGAAAPAYTASIDATLALVERVLPDTVLDMSTPNRWAEEDTFYATITPQQQPFPVELDITAEAPTAVPGEP